MTRRQTYPNRKRQPRRWPGTPEASVTDGARMPATAAKWHLEHDLPLSQALARINRPAQAVTAVLGAKDNHE